jgi:hypothetical protein
MSLGAREQILGGGRQGEVPPHWTPQLCTGAPLSCTLTGATPFATSSVSSLSASFLLCSGSPGSECEVSKNVSDACEYFCWSPCWPECSAHCVGLCLHTLFGVANSGGEGGGSPLPETTCASSCYQGNNYKDTIVPCNFNQKLYKAQWRDTAAAGHCVQYWWQPTCSGLQLLYCDMKLLQVIVYMYSTDIPLLVANVQCPTAVILRYAAAAGHCVHVQYWYTAAGSQRAVVYSCYIAIYSCCRSLCTILVYRC